MSNFGHQKSTKRQQKMKKIKVVKNDSEHPIKLYFGFL